MNRTEYAAKLVAKTGLPPVVVTQAMDMAEQAFTKAMNAMKATIDLHHDERVRNIASALFVELMSIEMEDRKPYAALLVRMEMLR